MSKFRQNKSSVKVTGKLPTRALYIPLNSLHGNFPDLNEIERKNRGKEFLEYDSAFHNFFWSRGSEEECFISLVNTRDISVSVVEKNGSHNGLVVSLGYLVDAANVLLSKGICSSMALKLLDLCRFVAEGDAAVVECKIPANTSAYGGYGYKVQDDFRGKLIPWLSKRYDKTTFYNHAVEVYPDEENFLKYLSEDLDYFRYGTLPKSVIASEIIIFKEEWRAGALKNA